MQLSAIEHFRSRLLDLKKAHASPDFAWYPYDSFGVFNVLNSHFSPERRDLPALARPGGLLDVGCGDGDLSFLFESLGLRVSAIDCSGPNQNRTLGFQTLHAALGSSVEFQDRDLDAGLDLRGRTFGLALCLGVLYHLKNPFGLLETLSRHARHCLLSTRIARRTPSGTGIASEPVAYLLDPYEANSDASNFWVFSEAGLRRLLARTGWDVIEFASTGCRSGSNPSDPARDERAFCLLASKRSDPWLGCDLESGWHAMEDDSWRWTERVFTARLHAAESAQPALRFRFSVPGAALRSAGALRLEAAVDGHRLPACKYSTAGEHVYEQPVPREACGRDVTVRFELDRAMAPGGADRRELGVQVIFWTYAADGPREATPLAIG